MRRLHQGQVQGQQRSPLGACRQPLHGQFGVMPHCRRIRIGVQFLAQLPEPFRPLFREGQQVHSLTGYLSRTNPRGACATIPAPPKSGEPRVCWKGNTGIGQPWLMGVLEQRRRGVGPVRIRLRDWRSLLQLRNQKTFQGDAAHRRLVDLLSR